MTGLVQRGAEQYVQQAKDYMISVGCDKDCITNLRPDDLDSLIQDRCQCLRALSPGQLNDFVASDW
jgi:hypothetical protein